jgi:hypothetical protein
MQKKTNDSNAITAKISNMHWRVSAQSLNGKTNKNNL